MEALSWVGTPFMLNSRVKGERGGVSCHNLMIGAWEGVGVELGFESPKGSGRPGDQKKLKLISQFMADKHQFVEIEPGADLMVGDMISFVMTSGEYHCGMFLGEVDGNKKTVIQSMKPDGVTIESLANSDVYNRVIGVWRLKHESQWQ